MFYVQVEANKISQLKVKAGQDIVVYNLSPEHSIDLISGPNGLINVAVLPRSGIALRADSVMSVRAIAGEVLVGYETLDNTQASKPLSGLSFYLDAGHGGSDPGAVNAYLGLQEKVAALDVCLSLGSKIIKAGGDVHYSRLIDNYPSLTERAATANDLNVDAFISIHLNSAENKSASGVETLVYAINGGKAARLAEAVQENLVAATNFRNRGVKARPDLHVLRATKMPAILCEIGFISNDDEAKQLFDLKVQDKIAGAICQGVIKIFGV